MKKVINCFILFVLAFFACSSITAQPAFADESSVVTSVKASHILVNSKEEAELIKWKLDQGESFEALAKEYSRCPSAANGGDLGYFERGQMVKPFEDAAFCLPVGKASDPVKTQFGWHIIKVYERK